MVGFCSGCDINWVLGPESISLSRGSAALSQYSEICYRKGQDSLHFTQCVGISWGQQGPPHQCPQETVHWPASAGLM